MARTLLSAPPTDRIGRYPRHPFLSKEIPFTLQPIMLARVLPGETLQNMYFETRVVSDPILNPIIGWKKEYYFFYVKATDIMLDVFKDMFVDPSNAEMAGHDLGANATETYAAAGAVDWYAKCLERVCETYFRDEGEAASAYTASNGAYIVQHRQNSFLDSLTDKDDMPEGEDIAGATTAGDLDRLMDAFEMLRAMGIANMTYEDWLRSQGIAIPEKDENKPELLARFSDFQYPSNTIDPTSGAPSSAVSWVFKNSENKRKFFKEPGFVLGVSVTRPKIYLGGLAGAAAGFAQRAWDWMPSYVHNMPETSLKNFPVGTGPLGVRTTPWDAYFLDMRDELLYGDQYQNMVAFNADQDVAAGVNHMFNLPNATGGWKYPAETDIVSIFKTPASAYYVRQDGYVSLNVKGVQVDYTVGNFAAE